MARRGNSAAALRAGRNLPGGYRAGLTGYVDMLQVGDLVGARNSSVAYGKGNNLNYENTTLN